MQVIRQYIDEHKQRMLDELFDLLRFPSVSADPKYKADVLKTADYTAAKLREAGADNVEICPTAGYPIVYGEKIIDSSKPTVLVYGHYDVQRPIRLSCGKHRRLNLRFAMVKFMPVAHATTKASFTCM